MKLFAPKYYKRFKCTADKCDHSCCIGWEIDVDIKTFDRYKTLNNHYKSNILNSISTEDTPHFILSSGDRCPHLDENGLCRIILNVGEDYLCDICREHPRFYNYTDAAEVGLGMSCREAARLILSSSDYDEFDVIGDVSVSAEPDSYGKTERDRVYALLKNDALDYESKLRSIYTEYGIDIGDDGDYLDVLDTMEYLDPSHKQMFSAYASQSRPIGVDDFLERALAYFIYRHCTEALDEDDFAARLGFCLFCERLFASLVLSRKASTVCEMSYLASVISEEIEYSEDNTAALMYL